MKLFVIECNDSKLYSFISAAAAKMRPKPEFISTVRLNMDRFSVPEFKKILSDLAPDSIVLNPPHIPPECEKWNALVKEVIRSTEVLSGRLLFVSHVDVLGDAQQRSEVAVEMPDTDRGAFLQTTEAKIQNGTSRHYIARFPYTIEDKKVIQWLYGAPADKVECRDEVFTMTTLEDMAKEILTMLETGWFGKFHVTPNDSLLLSGVSEIPGDSTKRVSDRSLWSKHTWKMTYSSIIWKKLRENVIVEASQTAPMAVLPLS